MWKRQLNFHVWHNSIHTEFHTKETYKDSGCLKQKREISGNVLLTIRYENSSYWGTKVFLHIKKNHGQTNLKRNLLILFDLPSSVAGNFITIWSSCRIILFFKKNQHFSMFVLLRITKIFFNIENQDSFHLTKQKLWSENTQFPNTLSSLIPIIKTSLNSLLNFYFLV